MSEKLSARSTSHRPRSRPVSSRTRAVGRESLEGDSPWKSVGVHVTWSSVLKTQRDIRQVPVPRTKCSGEKPKEQ